MKPIPHSEWPEFSAERNTTTVAIITRELDDFVSKLKARPKQFTYKATRGAPERRYRCIFLRLSNGAYASLTELEDVRGRVDLDLEILRHEFVYEDDFAEVMSELELRPAEVEKFEDNFTWLANRKAKKTKRKEEPLPEDWWNHVRVIAPSKKAPK